VPEVIPPNSLGEPIIKATWSPLTNPGLLRKMLREEACVRGRAAAAAAAAANRERHLQRLELLMLRADMP
jgi:hypothetical protein